MSRAAIRLSDDAEREPLSPQMEQYFRLRGRAIALLEKQKSEQAQASIAATLAMDETKPQRPQHLRAVTPQVQIDFIRSLEHQDDAARQAWMDRWIADEVSNTIEQLERNEPISKLVVGEALVAGLVNPNYMPEGQLGPAFAAQVTAHNKGDFFKLSIPGARRNGMIPWNMSNQAAESALWDIYNTIAVD